MMIGWIKRQLNVMTFKLSNVIRLLVCVGKKKFKEFWTINWTFLQMDRMESVQCDQHCIHHNKPIFNTQACIQNTIEKGEKKTFDPISHFPHKLSLSLSPSNLSKFSLFFKTFLLLYLSSFSFVVIWHFPIASKQMDETRKKKKTRNRGKTVPMKYKQYPKRHGKRWMFLNDSQIDLIYFVANMTATRINTMPKCHFLFFFFSFFLYFLFDSLLSLCVHRFCMCQQHKEKKRKNKSYLSKTYFSFRWNRLFLFSFCFSGVASAGVSIPVNISNIGM